MRNVVFPSDKRVNYGVCGYSAAVRSGSVLVISGQVGVDASSSAIKVPADQFQLAFANLSGVLEARGDEFDDIVDVTTFHVNMYNHFEAFSGVK